MQFLWDPRKDAANLKKHGLSFDPAARVFEDPHAVSYPDRVIDGETR